MYFAYTFIKLVINHSATNDTGGRVISKSFFSWRFQEHEGTHLILLSYRLSMTVGTHKTIFNLLFAAFGLHESYRGPTCIYNNDTSNALLTPSTTELSTLGRIFGIRRQNYQNSVIGEKIFFGRKWLTP